MTAFAALAALAATIACTSSGSGDATYVRAVCEATRSADESLQQANDIVDQAAQLEAVVAAFQASSDSVAVIDPPEGARAWHDGWVDRYAQMADGYTTQGPSYRDRLGELPPIPPMESETIAEDLRAAAAGDEVCRSIEGNPFGSPLPE